MMKNYCITIQQMSRGGTIDSRLRGNDRFFLFVSFALFIFNYTLNAGNLPGMDFLRLNGGPRPSAMGGAFTAISDDNDALYFNPAGMVFAQNQIFRASYAKWFADMTYQDIGWLKPFKKSALGINILHLAAPDDDLIVLGEIQKGGLKYSDSVLNIGYARALTDLLSMGISAKAIKNDIAGYSRMSFAPDVGFLFRTREKLFSAGLTVKNFGSAPALKTQAEALPLSVRAGTNLHIEFPSQESAMNISLDYDKAAQNDKSGGLFLGFEHNGMNAFFLRAGFKILNSSNTFNDFGKFTLGFGLKIKNLTLNYAYLPFDTFGFNQIFSVGWAFKRREMKKASMLLGADPRLISPDRDGILETVRFESFSANLGVAENWELKISDKSGAGIKYFRGQKILPAFIIWDGTDQAGKVLPSGAYSMQLSVMGKEEAESNIVKVEIDTVAPVVSLSLTEMEFSPDDDGILDTTTFYLKVLDNMKIAGWDMRVLIDKEFARGKKYLSAVFDFDTVNLPSTEGIMLADSLRQEISRNIEFMSLVDRKKRELEMAQLAIRSIGLTNIEELKRINKNLGLQYAVIGRITKIETGNILNVKVMDARNYNLLCSTAIAYKDTAAANDVVLSFSSFLKEEFVNGKHFRERRVIKKISGKDAVPEFIVWDGKDDIYGYVVPNDTYTVILSAYDTAGIYAETEPAFCSVNVPPKVVVKEVEVIVIKEIVKEIIKEVPVKEDARGLKFDLDASILFGAGQSDLSKAGEDVIDKIVLILKEYPENDVAIEGHTDSTGNAQKNKELSSARAWKIYSRLVKAGIEKSRFKIKGFGSEKSIADNDTPEGREKNRRVEIIILKK